MNQLTLMRTSYKMLFGLLGFSAIVTEIATLVERGRFNPVNFFSFFTVESNVLVVVILLLSALATAAGKNDKLDVWRSAITVYILIVGIGFSWLLAGLENTQFTAVPWDNIVLHYIMPAAMLGDFLLDRPRQRMAFRWALTWLLFPIGYVGYSLIRGSAVGWYPYPFLNPAREGGYGAVFLTIVALIILATILTWIVVSMAKLSGRSRA